MIAALARPRRAPRLDRWTLLLLPGVAFLLAFFGLPLLDIAVRSVEDFPANYAIVGDSPVYARVLGTTFRTAAVVTIVCLVLGYPYAYVMHHAGPRLAAALGVAVLVPFWSSLLVRTYAWTVLLQDTGLINTFLLDLGVVSEPIPLIRNAVGVTIGMSYILLPFMVLPIYAVMRRIDPDLSSAAASLGAPPFQVFRRVFLPLSLPGVAAGSLLVFVLSLGFYITPALLGSPRDAMLSEVIVDRVSQRLEFGEGSALAMILLGLTLLLLAAASRIVRLRDVFGAGTD